MVLATHRINDKLPLRDTNYTNYHEVSYLLAALLSCHSERSEESLDLFFAPRACAEQNQRCFASLNMTEERAELNTLSTCEFQAASSNLAPNSCELVNRADRISEIDGKAARVAASEQGSERVSNSCLNSCLYLLAALAAATILSKRGSPRKSSQHGLRSRSPYVTA